MNANYEAEMARRAAFAERFPELSAQAVESEERIAFIRSLPRATVAPADAPACDCHSFTLWRVGTERWRCCACDPPQACDGIEAVRATIAGRQVWDAAAGRWEATKADPR